MESFDATQHPWGWEHVGFDDSSWKKAFEITPLHTGADGRKSPPSSPFGMLRPPVRTSFQGGTSHPAKYVGHTRVIGSPQNADPVRQVLLDQETPTSRETDAVEIRFFDIGHIAAGLMTLRIRNAVPGTVIDIAVSEHIDSSNKLVTLGQHAGLRFISDGEIGTFESFDILGMRYIHAAIRIPRNKESSVEQSKIELEIEVTDQHRPRPDGASFECSDPRLNLIHAIGLRTVDLCALDAYVDCPTREQRAWTGDSVVHQMVDFVSNPDW
jgi:hypothetical protein